MKLQWHRSQIQAVRGILGGPIFRRSIWHVLVLAFILASAGTTALSQNASANSDSSRVIQFLNQTIDWYRRVAPVQQTASETDDLLVLSDNGRMADQVVRLAFDFARAEAEVIANQPNSALNENAKTGSPQYSSLMQLEAKLDGQTRQAQSELEGVQKKMGAATGKKRRELQAQTEELQGELELIQARKDAIRNLTQFVGGSGATGLGATALQTQIQALAEAVPAASPPSNESAASLSSKEQLSRALIATTNKAAPSGIWELTANLFALSQQIHMVDAAIQQTNALAVRSKEMRAPLIGRLKELSAQGDQLGKEADSANQSELGQEKQQLDALAAQFKQISAASIPLSKQGILLDSYKKSLAGWKGTLQDRRMAGVKGLLVRVTFLLLVLGVVVAAAELWRRAAHRYVHEPRRRYQLLLLRRFVMWFTISVAIALAFASKLGSVATFAGLLTAGVAVALQNVILSIVGYFFLIGKYGIRVGDRVEIGGVKGEVVDVGLVRLHLMELSGADRIPTGRVVAFSNSIVFQPTAGLFKQIPGTNFLWHEVTLALSPDTDYASVKDRLLRIVEAVLADYRDDLERQYRAMQTTLFSPSADAFQPTAQLRFTPAAVEVVIRFPVDRQRASEIDERVMRELAKDLDREPKLKVASSASPSIAVKTDLMAA